MRSIPDAAKRGVIRPVGGMVVSIDGVTALLSPAARIRDQQNLIIVPSALPSEGATARYDIDVDGQVQRVWLLTPEEMARPEKSKSGGG
ncbi:MAG: hypothetical protein EXR27_06185 [Betaproteobacteria bacterium]|nr:hypothetical protein [Betaproteobacteria bacterium]